MSTTWSRLVDHARSHHAVTTWAEAIALGARDDDLVNWQRSGRLVRPAPNVYVVAGSPPTWRQRVRVAACSTDGWASHRTAAALWGLDGFPPGKIEVLVPYGRRRRRGDWVVHETRALRSVDLDEVDGIPCTSVVRTVIDLAAVSHPFLVGQALDHASRRWPGSLAAVERRHAELARRGRRGIRMLRALLDERAGRGRYTDSGFETRALRMLRAAGLPEPVLQHTVRDGDFVAHLDLAWPSVMWAVECDSLAHHSGKRAHEWDRMRRRRLKALGWDVVEITYDDVTVRRAETARQLVELYRARELSRSVGPDPSHSR
jgi:very-short-patch-repair endonuclease